MLAPELAVPPSEPRFVSWYVARPPFSPEALRAVPASTASATSNKVSRRFTNDLLDVVFVDGRISTDTKRLRRRRRGRTPDSDDVAGDRYLFARRGEQRDANPRADSTSAAAVIPQEVRLDLAADEFSVVCESLRRTVSVYKVSHAVRLREAP